ncbi:12814_t:CDS:2, partial [Funneliformis geosporum]
EKGEWTGILKKEVENFKNILERVLEQASSKDNEWIKKLRSFGTKKIGKLLLKRDVRWVVNNSSGHKKSMWERIEIELEEIDIESLGFDHPICSEVLDKLKLFTKMPGSFCDIFKEPFEKYKLDHNNMMIDT